MTIGSAELASICAEIWDCLAAAVSDRTSPLRTPALATVSPEGAPQVRTVVLRKAAAGAARLEIHTDIRSPKAAALRHDPRAELTFWDPARQWQIRASARAEIITDGPDADHAWAITPDASRRNYSDSAAPGTRLHPQNPSLCHESPSPFPATLSASDSAPDPRAAFALLRLHVTQIDWLHLSPEGNRRAKFHFIDDSAASEAYWVAP